MHCDLCLSFYLDTFTVHMQYNHFIENVTLHRWHKSGYIALRLQWGVSHNKDLHIRMLTASIFTSKDHFPADLLEISQLGMWIQTPLNAIVWWLQNHMEVLNYSLEMPQGKILLQIFLWCDLKKTLLLLSALQLFLSLKSMCNCKGVDQWSQRSDGHDGSRQVAGNIR